MIGSKKNKKNTRKKSGAEYIINKETPFAVAEAYKTLRTNLIFSLPGKECKIIEVTSSVQGEGKSTTSINLAKSLAESGRKVLLIDCDLRLPTDALKLQRSADTGLSNVLAGLDSWDEVIQYCGDELYLMPAGEVPPNPAELLDSIEMQRLLSILKKEYDFIILDAPPVTVVSDAVILSKFATGVILVVQHGTSDRELVARAVNTLEFASARIIGFVYTRAMSGKSKKSKYYGYGYGSSEGAPLKK